MTHLLREWTATASSSWSSPTSTARGVLGPVQVVQAKVGSGFRVQCLGFRVKGLGFRVTSPATARPSSSDKAANYHEGKEEYMLKNWATSKCSQGPKMFLGSVLAPNRKLEKQTRNVRY